MSLYEAVTGWLEAQRTKHGLRDDYVEYVVNAMSNAELLQAISEGLEELRKQDVRDSVQQGNLNTEKRNG